MAGVAQYDPVAERYETWIVPKFRPVAETLVAAADVRVDDAVVEVAAGTGGLSRLILPRLGSRGSLLATDIAEGMLAVARRVLDATPPGPHGRPAIRVETADLIALPVNDASADLVIGQMTPLLDVDGGLAEARRALRPGGRLAFATWGARYAENRLLNASRQVAGIDPYPFVELRRIAPRLRAAGFTEVRQRTRPRTVVHDSAEAYLAYRESFGVLSNLDPAIVERYRTELARRARELAPDGGPLRLGWSITVVTAVRS